MQHESSLPRQPREVFSLFIFIFFSLSLSLLLLCFANYFQLHSAFFHCSICCRLTLWGTYMRFLSCFCVVADDRSYKLLSIKVHNYNNWNRDARLRHKLRHCERIFLLADSLSVSPQWHSPTLIWQYYIFFVSTFIYLCEIASRPQALEISWKNCSHSWVAKKIFNNSVWNADDDDGEENWNNQEFKLIVYYYIHHKVL